MAGRAAGLDAAAAGGCRRTCGCSAGPRSAAGRRCDWLLVTGNSKQELAAPDGKWTRVWEGNRPADRKEKCPAFEFKAGQMCWFISGTACQGKVHKTFDEKMNVCRCCDVLQDRL